jgi:hypothetical protein
MNQQTVADHHKMITFRRRAIFHGLCEVMPMSSAQSAVEIWQTEYSDKPVYALQPFISRIRSAFSIDVPRNIIQRALINALSLDASELPKDPLANKAIDKPYLKPSAETDLVFTQLMRQILINAEHHNAAMILNVRTAVTERIKRMTLKRELQDQLIGLIHQPKSVQKVLTGLTVNQMREALHSLYVDLCAYIGPVETDRLLGDALKKIEKLPEAKVFAPRSLL